MAKATSKNEKKVRTFKKLPMHLRKAVTNQNKARAACGLAPLTVSIRSCLVCGSKFESVGNRLCGCIPRKAPYVAGSEVIH